MIGKTTGKANRWVYLSKNMSQKNKQKIVVVDEQDQQIGVMDKLEAHRHPVQLHRASSVLLFQNRQSQLFLLIQQRSQYKIVGAHQWSNTMCTNLQPGESYRQAAERRLDQELGITKAKLTDAHTFTYQAKCNQEFGEHEIDHIFVGWLTQNIDLNPQEISNIKWVNWQKLITGQHSLKLTPWFKHMLNDDELQQKVLAWSQTNVK